MQSDMYKRCHEIGSNRVNIALVQNIKNFDRWETEDLVKALTTNVTDEKTQETIAKEIKNIPADIAHRFFEEYSNTKVSAIIKYLARNINCYYKDLENRKIISSKTNDPRPCCRCSK